MNINISNSSQEPIYSQIKNQIKQSILRNDMEAGEALPSMRRLAQDLRISVITTKRAYEELESEGFITSFVGKGSFVAGQNQDLIKEKRIKEVEVRMGEIVNESKNLNISLQQLHDLVTMLYEEEE
ncbi:GntR family transcriptional regulator [Halobacillus sp. K22]|uniref:GntR family transcriptional regulator n=1 Tax=Halobacillus sp. K22 TaxID=3457431 RepID=UPI003FCD6BFA